MDLLMKTLTEQSEPGFDLILKDHEPTRKINACRLLRKLSRYRQLRQIPVVVMSSQDDRDTVVKCLHLGAADYLVKPLRHNELRNLWTRVWWRRIVNTYRSQDAPFLSQGSLASNPVPELREHGYPSPPPTLSASEETKCDEDEPTSKEGSAPVGEGSGKGTDGEAGSGGDAGSGGSGANVSRVPPYILEDGNGNSGSKNCITGHGSATKNGGSGGNMGSNGNGSNGNGGSNGNRNGASTTHALEGPSSNALRGTAQGGTREFVGRHAAKAATAADDMSPYSGETNIKIGQSSKRSHGGHQLLKESNKKAASAGVDENKPFHAAADEPKTAPPNRKVSGSLERSGRTEARDKVERYSNGGVWQSARAEVKSGTASGGLHIPSRGAETVSEDTQMRVTGTSSGRPGTSPQRASGLGPGSRNSFGKAHASQSGTACGSYPGQVTDSGLELPHLNPQMWPTPYPAAHMQQMPPGMQHPFASWNPSQFDMIHGSGYHPYHALFMRQAQNGSTHPALQEQRQSPGHPAWIPGFDSQGTRVRCPCADDLPLCVTLCFACFAIYHHLPKLYLSYLQGHSAMYGSRGGPRSGYPGGYDQSVGAGFYASHGMVRAPWIVS